MSKNFDILILGVTGFTGRLVARYLFSHPQFRTHFTFAIGARSRSKLDELIQELSLDESVPSIQVDVTDFNSLENAVKQTKVVINTVGPYWKWGKPVVRACVNHNVHYVDLAGESYWIKDIIEEFHIPASRNGTIIVPACGFDSIPSEIAAFLSNKALKEISPEVEMGDSITSVDVAGSLSGGTLNSAITSMENVPKDKLRAAERDFSLSPVGGIPSSSRVKLLYKLPLLNPTVYGTFWFMKPTNRSIVQRTWGLHQQALELSNSSAEKKLAYGPQFRYDEFWQASGPVGSVFSGLVLITALISLATLRPLRRLVSKWFPPGSGPSEQKMQKGHMKLINISFSSNLPTQVAVKSVVSGRGDPGYLLTSIMLSESALSILLDRDSLPPIGKKGGILTPMSAFGDRLIQRLEKTGKFGFEYSRLQ